jgi:subtilisin family serine protease
VEKRKLMFKIISICVIILLILQIAFKTNEEIETPDHRRQSWLAQINWECQRYHYSGKNIKVGVIDTGVDSTTSEIKKDIVFKHSVINNVGDKSDVSHGTAICGIITGEPYNNKEILGVAPDAKIISIDVTDDEDGLVEISNLVLGIKEAIEEKVDIINISVGCMKGTDELKEVIDAALSKNIIVVCSAGNLMENKMLFPSSYEGVISVGSKKRDGSIISPKGKLKKKVFYFPGENIVTSIGNKQYAGCNGTSFSTAICSGTIALLLEKNNDKKRVISYWNNIKDNYITDIKKIIDDYS